MPRRKRNAALSKTEEVETAEVTRSAMPRYNLPTESPNRVVWPRRVNRPRPGDKVGQRPIVF